MTDFDPTTTPYAKLDQIATRAGSLQCAHCGENLRSHAGIRCLFDGASTFKTLSVLDGYVDHWGHIFSVEECVKIIEEVNRRDQERWQTTTKSS